MNDHGRDHHAGTALDERVSTLLSAAAAPSEPGPLPGEDAAVTAFRASHSRARRRSMTSSFGRVRTGVAAVTVGAGVLLAGGVTAAAAGGLPGAAQDTARDMLDRIGVVVPGATEASDGSADDRGKSDAALAEDPADTATSGAAATDGAGSVADDRAGGGDEAGDSGQGADISDLATSTDAEGVAKGALISGTASDGKSRAGEDHGSSSETPERSGGPGEEADATSESAAESGKVKASSDDSEDADGSDEDADKDSDEDDASAEHRRDGAHN